MFLSLNYRIKKAVLTRQDYKPMDEYYRATLSWIDTLADGVCFTLNCGEVVIHNKKADELLLNSDEVRLNNENRLLCHNGENQEALETAIQSVCSPLVSNDLCFIIFLEAQKNTGSTSIILEVTPLFEQVGKKTVSMEMAIISLVPLLQPTHLSIDRAEMAFGLTKAESTVCQMLVNGSTTREIAEQRNVTTETIKSQIHSLLRKSQCKRRSDLIRLISSISKPLSRK